MFDPGVSTVPVADAQHAVAAAAAIPSGMLPWLRQQASNLGISLWTLLVYLGRNPTILATIIGDFAVGNFVKAAADLIAAWQASQGGATP